MPASLLTIFVSSFVIALSGALMPGPVMTVTISESARRGALTGPLVILGHAVLELILVIALLAGLAPFFSRDEVFIAVSLLGGLILCWMAFGMFRDLPNLSLAYSQTGEKSRSLVMAGILLSLANPYWLIWWATVGLGYIMYATTFGTAGVIAFYLGHIGADFVWYSLISIGIAKGKRFISDLFYRRLVGCCAALLLLFSGYFFYGGLTKII